MLLLFAIEVREMKTIGDLIRFFDEWDLKLGIDDCDFKEALLNEMGIELLIITTTEGEK
jgi:hypothetical protein